MTRAEMQLELARRQVAAEIGRARVMLSATKRVAADWAKRRGQIERAWRLGELPLIEVVRARNASAASTVRLAIAEGVIP